MEVNLQSLTEIATKFKKNRETLRELNAAIAKNANLQLYFRYSKSVIEKLEVMREQARDEGIRFSDLNYETAKEGFEKGDYEVAQNIALLDIEDMESLLELFENSKDLVHSFSRAIEEAKEHLLIEQFVKTEEEAERSLEERDLEKTINLASIGIQEISDALKNWIPKIRITLPDDLVATESNRAVVLVENIGKVKINAVKLVMDGLTVSGNLSTNVIEPSNSEELVVAMVPATPGNIPVTITSSCFRSYDNTETIIDEQVWIEILRPEFATTKSSKKKTEVTKEIEKEIIIEPEWTPPPNLSNEETIIGDFFGKRWESYQAYPDNNTILDHLHNNREKYAISSYFEIPNEPKGVMEDWALPHNLRGNIYLDSKRKEIVRDIFESPYEKNYVVIGEPGVGKTVLLFEIFDQLMKREPVAILTNENIGDAHEKFKVRLFYDDISEKPDLYKAIASKDSISGLILSSREAEWSELPVDFRKKFIRLTVPRFSDEEMEQLILKTLEINAILHDVKALKTLVSYAQGSPIYVGSLIKEMAYNGVRRLSETYLKENAQKGMEGYVIMILQRLLKSGNEYRAGGLHTLSCLMFLANHIEERKCHEQLLRSFADKIDSPMEEKFDDVYDRRTFNRSIDYLSGEGSLVRFPHDTWVDILQGQGASNPFRPDIQEIRKEFEDTGRFEELKKDAIADAWEAIQKRYRRNNVREKDSFLELCDTLTSNFRLSDLKEKGVDIDMIREVTSKHRDELVAATILSRLEGAEPTHSVINIQDSVINRSEIGAEK
jgi:hypothetical protein